MTYVRHRTSRPGPPSPRHHIAGPSDCGARTRRPGGRAAVGQGRRRPSAGTAKSGELDDTCKFFIVLVAARTQGLGDCHTVIHWPGNRRLDDASESRTVRSGLTGQRLRISLISTRSPQPIHQGDRVRAAAGQGRRRPSAKPGGLDDTCEIFDVS